MNHLTTLLLALLTSIASLAAQTTPFNLVLEPLTIPSLGGLQSYAFGEYGGKWLIIGGRLDGLHRRQPFASFDVAGHNNQLMVVDPKTLQQWTAPLSSLPAAMQEQLSATNMAFFQEGERLYLTGGYGYSPTLGDHTTYGALMAIDLPGAIQAVLSGAPLLPHMRQVTDLGFTVTGGRLGKLYDTYYLVGGQNFQGRYNPMGPTHGPGFFQEYTNSVRRFRLSDDGNTLTVKHLAPWVDAAQLHRRDFNVVPQIMPNGQEGLTAFSGVFQTAVDLPYLNCLNIDSAGYAPQPTFQQYYNHYHSATLPLYDATTKEMHSVFFGGIAQFYDSLGTLVQDNNVPFVKTIARVTRTPDGQMKEYKMPVGMPAYLGAGAEFIPAAGTPAYPNGVLKLDAIADQSILGYIYGGIRSTAPNIFWVNDGTQSVAATSVYRVRLLKKPSSGIHLLNPQSQSSLRVEVLPNPNAGRFEVRYQLQRDMPVTLRLRSLEGKTIEEVKWPNMQAGAHTYTVQALSTQQRGLFWLTVETPAEVVTRKVMIDP
ncbi:MAG TPA: T9SS C-terminal target domain-containing protein [Saprospiraceae bacterium]|nr:T9SS C-terminal target domain-containing protein [Saprospiraceae bacterium]